MYYFREKLKIPSNEQINTCGILKKYSDIEKSNKELSKKIKSYENRLISLEIDNHEKETMIATLKMTTKTEKLNENVKNQNLVSLNQAIDKYV